MLGICLKRYTVTNKGQPIRLNTHIDIPLEMSSPHFTSDDSADDNGSEAGNFKLSLQSVICHRGASTHSGHYISLVRAGARLVGHGEHARYEDMWLRHDDLAMERVKPVDILAALKEESPYLLFYRVVPIREDPPSPEPPVYSESDTEMSLLEQKLADLPSLRTDVSTADSQSRRPSLDVYSPEDARGRNSMTDARQPSIVWTDESRAPSIRSDLPGTEPNTPPEDTSRSNNYLLSRQTTRNSKVSTTSRPISNGSEKKFGLSMAKLTARMGNRDLKLGNPDITVSEVNDDGVVVDPSATLSPSLQALHTETAAPPPSFMLDTRQKSKDRSLKRFKGGSRRSSLAVGAGEHGDKPDRECIIM